MKKTLLEVIEFGENPEDTFYCLIDEAISPNGFDVSKLKLSDPRNFDRALKESGCLMMFTGNEIGELISRGDVDQENIHESLVLLAQQEGLLKKN
ncbi:hypothetical protein BH23BAC3_BH23BAC3_22870 [soil metagenome]